MHPFHFCLRPDPTGGPGGGVPGRRRRHGPGRRHRPGGPGPLGPQVAFGGRGHQERPLDAAAGVRRWGRATHRGRGVLRADGGVHLRRPALPLHQRELPADRIDPDPEPGDHRRQRVQRRSVRRHRASPAHLRRQGGPGGSCREEGRCPWTSSSWGPGGPPLRKVSCWWRSSCRRPRPTAAGGTSA